MRAVLLWMELIFERMCCEYQCCDIVAPGAEVHYRGQTKGAASRKDCVACGQLVKLLDEPNGWLRIHAQANLSKVRYFGQSIGTDRGIVVVHLRTQ